MNSRLTLAVSALALSLSAAAAPISPDQALQRFAATATPGKAKAVTSLQLAHTQRMADGIVSAYIFVPENGEGFTILSADDAAVPVLGYSDSGSLDINNLPPALTWWLDLQEELVQHFTSGGKKCEPFLYAPSDMKAIAPMVKTKWNQDAPYNNDCPTVNGTKTPTGCVATSFSQVMNYFQYPDKGTGSVRYSDGATVRSMTFTREIDWANMLDEYVTGSYTDAQAAAVSWLMKACGYSVEMAYNPIGSGAQSYRLVNAAVNNFKYDIGTYYAERDLYSTETWTRMVYDNLKNCGPVIYDGSAVEGGHSFVCDGYDGNGYFHFNWGWGGMSDGYYVLNSLNPESQGIGGAEGGFNFQQGALFGMRKPVAGSVAPQDMMRVSGSAKGELTDNGEILFTAYGASLVGWGNGSFREIDVTIGAIYSDLNGNVKKEEAGVLLYTNGNTSSTIKVGAYGYMPTENANPLIPIPSGLPNGTYKVTLAAMQNNREDAVWSPFLYTWGNVNYCLLEIKDGVRTIKNVNQAMMEVEESHFDSPVYFNRNAKLATTFKNSSDEELTLCFTPKLYRNGKEQYVGDYLCVTVDANTTQEFSQIVSFEKADQATDYGAGEFTLVLYDNMAGKVLASCGEYDVQSVSSYLTLTLKDLAVAGATVENVTIGNRTFEDVYVIKGTDFNIHFAYLVDKGYLDSSMRLIVSQYDAANNKFNVMDRELFYDLPFLGEGQSFDELIPVDFSGQNYSTVYRVRASYLENNKSKTLGTIYFSFDASGVEGIVCDKDDSQAEYYNLQGLKVENPQPGQLLIRKSGSETKKIQF